MAIVRIAEKLISQEKRDWLNVLFTLWPSEADTMVSAATWHDDVSYSVARVMSQWHFSDIPIVHPQFTLQEEVITFNVTSVLNDTLTALFDPSTTDIWALHFLFRNLAHFIGDSHTPCHACAYFSEQYKTGDRGGNSVYLDYDTCTFGQPCGNLHKMWDSGVLNFQAGYLNTTDLLNEFEYNISHITEMHPQSSIPESTNLDPFKWINETYDVAVKYAYGKLVDIDQTDVRYKNIASDYIPEGQNQVEILISKAGYRLANIINKFWEIHNPEDPRMYTAEKVPAREIVAWILDSIVFLVIIVYIVLIIKDQKMFHTRFANGDSEIIKDQLNP